jgi:hypothetical protein
MMTQPDDAHGDEHSNPATAYNKLRAQLLTSGLYDWVSLAEVETIISQYHLADTIAERQELVLKTIRSLMEDGLMEIGELPGPDGKFPAWGPTVDEAMKRLYDRFVGHYADPPSWDFSIWLGLTDAGKRIAQSLEAQAAD